MKKSHLSSCIILLSFLLSMTSCKEKNLDNNKKVQRGILLKNMDTTVNPKDDFYNYVNGNWMKNTKIPDDRTRWGGFGVLRKKTDNDMLAIISKAIKNKTYKANTDQGKALSLFTSKLDTIARNKAGVQPLLPILDKINNVKTLEDFISVISENPVRISQPIFGIYAMSNPNNSAINSAYIVPGGLGLPDRDFYTNTDEASKKIRQQYVAHITKMLQFLGDDETSANNQAKTILAFETQLAEPRLDKVARRDFRNFNNPRSIEQLQKMVPTIHWKQVFDDLKINKKVDTVIVMQPKYMKMAEQLLKQKNLATLKTVTRWATLNDAASTLSTTINKANWEFYNKTLKGVKKQRAPKERALATVNNSMGEALGKVYVDEMFPPEAKEKAEKMIANVIDAYKKRILVLDWMSDSTKNKAIEKLNKFTVKIGYPNKWEDYSSMNISNDKSYFENMNAVNEWHFMDNLKKINEPVDRTKWGMSPQTVNAYFNPFNNEIVFPAAILQPPFYDYLADEAVNYGGIGAVIGHEISHAFDDSGARFDADGNLVNWWTDKDLENFTAKANKLAEQYSAIEVLDSVYINGKFTLGENIGDLGGVLGAYDGLQQFYKENGYPENIDGFTAEQRFFISWATVWRTLQREEALRNQIKTDPHSPGKIRATQPLLNVDAFYKAFDIKEGDGMFLPEKDRAKIW
ncbi:MAG: M13 family metallopeptidase [Flavobacteriales bacterium]